MSDKIRMLLVSSTCVIDTIKLPLSGRKSDGQGGGPSVFSPQVCRVDAPNDLTDDGS
jgi:hypothetical protein